MEVLNKIESIPSDKATDRPLREIKIINIEMFVSLLCLFLPLSCEPKLTPSFLCPNPSPPLLPSPSFQDPYSVYQTRLANKLASNLQLASTTLDKEKTRLERESDRTSWFGEDLDAQRLKADQKDHKRVGLEVGAGVGKYLGGGVGGGGEKKKRENKEEGGGGGGGFGGGAGPEKKKRKGAGGGFGDFSAW